MAAILKLNGLDLFTFLRVGPDEGLDPADNDFLQPQFNDGGVGEGAPLISITETNRELVYPMIISPAKLGYANTKDGLHQLVRDINRQLKVLQTVEWRDDGVTNSSFLDPQAARLEPDYSYRRGQHLYLQATLRIWTKPFAHTGTFRPLGTSVVTGMPVTPPITATGMDGDEPADVDLTLNWLPAGGATITDYPASGPLFAGYAVFDDANPMTLYNTPWLPPGTLARAANGGAPTLTGASGAAASQMITFNVGGAAEAAVFNLFGGLEYISPTGGARLVALFRNRAATSVVIHARDVNARLVDTDGATLVIEPIGPTQTFPASHQWRVVDLGVANGEQGIMIRVACSDGGAAATSRVDFGGLLVLPDARTVAAVARDDIGAAIMATHRLMTAPNVTFSRTMGATSQAGWPMDLQPFQRGHHPRIGVGATQQASLTFVRDKIVGFAVVDDGPQDAAVSVSVNVREKFTYHR